MLGTQPMQRATSKSNAALAVAGVWHTGIAFSHINSPVFVNLSISLLAGKIKSSTSSYRKIGMRLFKTIYTTHILAKKNNPYLTLIRQTPFISLLPRRYFCSGVRNPNSSLAMFK